MVGSGETATDSTSKYQSSPPLPPHSPQSPELSAAPLSWLGALSQTVGRTGRGLPCWGPWPGPAGSKHSEKAESLLPWPSVPAAARLGPAERWACHSPQPLPHFQSKKSARFQANHATGAGSTEMPESSSHALFRSQWCRNDTALPAHPSGTPRWFPFPSSYEPRSSWSFHWACDDGRLALHPSLLGTNLGLYSLGLELHHHCCFRPRIGDSAALAFLRGSSETRTFYTYGS